MDDNVPTTPVEELKCTACGRSANEGNCSGCIVPEGECKCEPLPKDNSESPADPSAPTGETTPPMGSTPGM